MTNDQARPLLIRRCMFAFSGCALAVTIAHAAAAGSTGGLDHVFEGTADHVRIVAVDRRSDGVDDKLKVTVAIAPGYHINDDPASQPYLIRSICCRG